MAPISIDGEEITGATIDGQNVSEITVDGETVFSAIPDSGIEQIGWNANGDEGSDVSQLGFVGGGRVIDNIAAIGFN